MGSANKRPRPDTTGLLVLDKAEGISSAAAVAVVRGKARGAKAGHAGTLDPLAGGVLVIALGRATKLLGRVMATPKRYLTAVDLSAFTDTDDREGTRSEVDVPAPPETPAVAAVLPRFTGRIMQRPPARSAVKVGGRRAYALSRSGTPVELEPRSVEIHRLRLVRYDWPKLELEVVCGRGTYIRSLARDIGSALGTGGHCATLRRTAVGPFDESMAKRLEELPEPLLEEHLMPVEEALRLLEGA